ncbi:MAG: cytochrome c biogenesis protein ResB [Candidatus Melainabacteria bacterium]|nr:cytochrome c biogenesis protein ResB [Candidatus Melainabacteria bacterium]
MISLKKYLKDFKAAFLEEFSSVKLAITLFIFLAITTLIGTVLPEEPMVGQAELIKKYGLQKYHLLKDLGLTDVFHSWWYLALLTTLGLNLIVASFRRVFPKCYLAFAWPVDLKEEGIKKLPINCELELNESFNLKAVEQKLKNKNFRTKTENGKLLAVKGGWHRLGASVTHIGILTLLFGTAITTLTGFNGMAQVSENEGFYLADLGQNTNQVKSVEPENWLAPISKMPVWFGRVPPYLVKVNKTWRVDYESGQPKQWYSDLSVFDKKKTEVTRKTIHVNEPLEFMGLDIYQSNWGKFALLSFNNEPATVPLENFHGEEVIFLPISDDVGLKLKIVQPKSDVLELYSISRINEKQKYLGSIKKNNKLQLGPINIGYAGTQTLTGLQFKSNPGGILIYPGLFLIVSGVFIAFGSRKQIWAAINTTSNKIIMGGNSDRAKGKFFEEFENIISELSLKR